MSTNVGTCEAKRTRTPKRSSPGLLACEDVRTIDDASETFLGVGDFFVIDSEHVVRSHYDQDGRFLGAELVIEASAKAPYIAFAELIWHTAQPFTGWWERHPEYHRIDVPTVGRPPTLHADSEEGQ